MGLRSWHQHGPWTLQLAVLDGVPGDPEHETRSTIKFGKHNGLLLLAETAIATDFGLRVAAGYWRHTASFDDLLATEANGEPQQRNDNHGYYALVDTRLIVQQEHRASVIAYLRYGQANTRINMIDDYLGGGVMLSDAFPGRSQDQLGLAVGIATAGHPYREAVAAQDMDTTRNERIVELTYFCPVTAWLSAPPIFNISNRRASIRNALAIGIRYELAAGLRN